MSTAFKLSIDKDGIAHIIFDLPDDKVNKLSVPVLEELEQLLDEAEKNSEIKALTISSGKPDIFIAGADLRSFEPIFRDPQQGEKIIASGHRVFNKLDSLPFPTIALINGACLGGGLELALACSYRLVSDNPKTILGLPEVTLGIIPGWGGTQRLPRLIGLTEALPMILSGKPVKAFKAWKINLADVIVPAAFFETKSQVFVNYILSKEGRRQVVSKRKRRSWHQFLLEKNPMGRSLLFRQARKELLLKTKGHYPAPLVALNLIEETNRLPIRAGLEKEIAAFTKNLSSSFADAPNLINLFFSQEALKKNSGLPGDVTAAKVSTVGVIGAGVMGSGISWLFTNQDIPVRFKDVDWAAISKGYADAYALYETLVKDKRLKASEASLKFHRMSGTTDYSGFKNTDLVIEAAVEDLEIKRQILKDLENEIRPDTIIGTNTSSLTLGEMNSALSKPERLVGMHFFNPPNKMPLVEVVASDKTSPKAIATAIDICRKLGKTPIVVRDCPGFLVNRIFLPGANEVMLMYGEGVDFERLEKVMLDFGMPMSPFVLADEVGNDVTYKVSKTFHEAYGERMVIPQIIEVMCQHEFFGKKTGKGFYLYKGKKRLMRNPQVENLRGAVLAGTASISDADILDRVLLSMINESARCLSENIVANPSFLDMALIMGIGFPPFRGGLLRYADKVGIDHVVNQLKHFKEVYGERFAPCELLIEMQNDHKSFF